jgi:hypothetical protein
VRWVGYCRRDSGTVGQGCMGPPREAGPGPLAPEAGIIPLDAEAEWPRRGEPMFWRLCGQIGAMRFRSAGIGRCLGLELAQATQQSDF